MSLPQFFERKASASPDALAIACAGRRINYRELNCQADRDSSGIARGRRDGRLPGRSPPRPVSGDGCRAAWHMESGGSLRRSRSSRIRRSDFLRVGGCSSSFCAHPQKVFCPDPWAPFEPTLARILRLPGPRHVWTWMTFAPGKIRRLRLNHSYRRRSRLCRSILPVRPGNPKGHRSPMEVSSIHCWPLVRT